MSQPLLHGDASPVRVGQMRSAKISPRAVSTVSVRDGLDVPMITHGTFLKELTSHSRVYVARLP